MSATMNPGQYKVLIEYAPGDGPRSGFFVTVSQPGESRTDPNSYISLRAALKNAERVLKKAGFVTIQPGRDEVEL